MDPMIVAAALGALRVLVAALLERGERTVMVVVVIQPSREVRR